MAINYNARKRNEGYNPASGSNVHQMMATQRQKEWITQLCEMKRVVCPNFDNMTQTEATEKIAVLQKMQNWREASEAQINRIISRCKDMGLDIPDMTGLGMAKASKWIEFLNHKWETEFANRVTQKQIEMIQKMCVCPDINNGELYNIPDEVWEKYDDKEMNLQIALSSQNEELIKNAMEELEAVKNEIEQFEANFKLEAITKQVASEFIGKNQATYYKWMSTRASDGQKDLINQLLRRMGNPELEEAVLMQFSRETADEYLKQLQTEMGDTSLHHFGNEAQELDVPDVWAKKAEMSKIRDIEQKEWEECVHALYATQGMQAENDILQASQKEKALDEVVDMLLDAGESKMTINTILLGIMTEDEVNEYMKRWEKATPAESQDVPW